MNTDSSRPPLPATPGHGSVDAATVREDGNQGTGDTRDHDSFQRNLVHDMRNAVAPLRNAAQLLRLRCKTDPGLDPITDIVERQVNQIVRMLNDLAGPARPGHDNLDPASGLDEHSKPPSVAAGAGKRILIVDDNPALLTSLSSLLREAGHDVNTATDGGHALALAQSWKPQFVLLDVQMPRMNGFEVAIQLRALFARDDMKLVLMSGASLDETTLRSAERAGFDHCIDKLHDFALLESLLSNDG